MNPLRILCDASNRAAAVCKSIEVAAPPVAFRIWTEGDRPLVLLATYSVGRGTAASCAIEGIPGGRVYETTRAGEEHLWGTVTLWEPPHRLAHTWHPGRASDDPTAVEVSFSSVAGGRTRLELVHRGWPPGAAARRADYDRGWDALLRDHYAACVRNITAG